MIETISLGLANTLFILLVVGIPCYGAYKKLNIFSVFTDGAKQGFEICVTILPFLLGMLVAIGMFRASGALDLLAVWLGPLLEQVGLSPELLPFILIRPFSGSAANGIMAEIINHHGGDAYISQLVATMMGSTETTFAVIAIYFGAVKITETRHAIPCGLFADAVGIMASVVVCRFLL